MVGPAVCLLAAAWLGRGGLDGRVADANVFAAAACVDVGLALSALTLAAGRASHLDVAPKHAGRGFATGTPAPRSPASSPCPSARKSSSARTKTGAWYSA